MDSLSDMKLFVNIVGSGSLSAAGRAAELSPASTSRRLTRLETMLGVRLVNRTSRKLSLTEVGKVYYDRAVEILRAAEALDEEVSHFHAAPRGLLHVHTRTPIATDFLAPILPQFLVRFPDLKLKLWLTEDAKDLIENRIDVAIRLGNLDEPSLAFRKIHSGLDRFLIASPEYLKQQTAIVRPEDVTDHNCLTYLDGKLQDGSAIWRFQQGESQTELRITGSLQTNNPQVLRHAALQGLGVTLLSGWLEGLDRDLKEGRLVRLLTDYSISAATFDSNLYAVFHRSTHLPNKVRVFIDFLVESFRKRSA